MTIMVACDPLIGLFSNLKRIVIPGRKRGKRLISLTKIFKLHKLNESQVYLKASQGVYIRRNCGIKPNLVISQNSTKRGLYNSQNTILYRLAVFLVCDITIIGFFDDVQTRKNNIKAH